MQGASVARGLQYSTADHSIAGLRQANRPVAALAEHVLVVDGAPVTIVIERPEVDRAGIAWRCRLRVLRGHGRREYSQVVGVSARAVLQQALDLATDRLGVTEAELLGGADVGGVLS